MFKLKEDKDKEMNDWEINPKQENRVQIDEEKK